MQRTVFYLFMLLALFSCSVDDGNANYIDFYEFVPTQIMREYAVIGGLDTGCDVEIIKLISS